MKPLFFFLCMTTITAYAQRHGHADRIHIDSRILRDNLVNANSSRVVNVYVPHGYQNSDKRYPVVYYFHNIFFSSDRLFKETPLLDRIDAAIDHDVVDEFILVAADFSTAQMGSFYENSGTSGRWLDFITEELVPFIDKQYRTIPQADARAAVGDFMGGRGALKLGMSYAHLFGVVYAMHPVGTGNGYSPWTLLDIDWPAVQHASTFSELAGKGRSQIFVAICQAFLPNEKHPPFYCDFFIDLTPSPVVNPTRMTSAKKAFHLEETLNDCLGNLKSLRGLAFDWGRFDPNQDHVYSNQAFSRKLTDLGIAHQAEEYNGGPFDKNWTVDGRFYTRVLPFVQAHLKFQEKP